ncbi:Zn-dependent M28 family amino/carboxypeptidase [Aeromicrobium panaciterrae]|uniref:Zn-dependent M28 family amino/carboxypeptidase n=1 Tax=Aeromicrobium panaciterrae TaxID=363861 RepID=A0ABU1UP09_9ACTN|nr:M20/M25/M40 family metallo-hydrolase [Aeromicrobium panaciterrae]MDR7086918.1 Zn-dependent M28 family amino/carboxypeptidase [Aeromicrobium panaciterrae]
MRRTLAIVAAVVVTSGLAITAPAVADQNSSKKSNSTSLTKAVTVNGILQHLRQLQTIADRNEGTRASGLPGHTASADYVAKKLRKAGYKVTRQKFTFAFSRELEPATLTEISPTAQEIETATLDYSGSGDVTGTVVPTNDLVLPPSPEPSSNSGCEAEDFEPAPDEPAIALIQRGTCTFETKAVNAAAAGYEAAIVFNEGQPGRDELLTGTLGNPVPIPVVGVSFADGAALADEAGDGPVTAQVVTSTEVDMNRETENVIADLPTKGKKVKNSDQVVVVGAHLDSVAAGPGINDNGSGSAAILEIAEEMSDLKLTKKLQRPVRFAFWGAEEAGLLGSEHYVTTLSDARRAKIYANLNFDMLGSPNYVRFVYDGDGSNGGDSGPPGSAAIESVFNDYFDSKGLATEPTDFDGRSDYGPFIAAGIPAGGLFSGAEGVKTDEEAVAYGGTAGAPYDSCYHQACDTINNLSATALQELGDGAAHAVYALTMSKAGLFGDANRKAAKVSAKQLKQYSSEATR